MTRKLFFILFAFLFLSLSADFLPAKEPKIFTLNPTKTVMQVRDEIRSWRAADPKNKDLPAVVEIRQGSYFFDAPIDLGPEDSNVSWQGEEGVVFTRGRKIEGWKVNEHGWFEVTIPEVAEGKWWFEQLFVNGRRADPARSPNQFYYYISDQVDSINDPKTDKPILTSARAFIPRQTELPLFEDLTSKNEPNFPENIQIKFYHSWATSLHRLESYILKNKTALLTGNARWNLTSWGRGGLRYQIFGTREALDIPGEFLLEKNGKLTYIPREGETLQNISCIAPDGPFAFEDSGFFRISGDLKKIESDSSPIHYARKIQLNKIIFSVDPFVLPHEGLSTGQAATITPNSIVINGGRDITIADCEFRHLGGYAIWFNLACRGGSVERCLIQDVGAGGVKIGSPTHTVLPSASAEENFTTKEITVSNTLVRGYGRIEASAIGLWIGGSSGNKLLHNEVIDGYYTGISVGWVWGYRPSKAFNNNIDFNVVHHIGQGVLSDMGAFYSLGISPGTTVRNNVMFDVRGYNHYGHGAAGLYTDEGSSQILFENNLVYNLNTAAVHQHYGENNIFRNNIFAFSEEAQLRRSRDEDHRSFTFENNIIVWDRDNLLGRSWNRPSAYVMKNNLYWFCGKPETDDQKEKKYFNGKTLPQWQKLGLDQGSLIADPGFADLAKRDFHFKDGVVSKAAEEIGFKPFDFTQAGISENVKKNWGVKYSNYELSPVVNAPDPPTPEPIEFKDSFDTPRISPILRVNSHLKALVQNWQLTVTSISAPGKETVKVICQDDELACENNVWNDLQWFGICANGDSESLTDIDNICVKGTKKNGRPFSMEEGFVQPRSFKNGQVVLSPANDSDAWKVLQENGNRFLRFHDSEKFKPTFNPHFFYRFSDLTGPVTISFDLRITENSQIFSQGREYLSGNNYKVGPSFTIDKKVLRAGGKNLAELIPGNWYHFVINCKSKNGIEPPWQIIKQEGNNPYLKISDSPLYKPSFEPHFFYTPNFQNGTVHFGFKCRFAENFNFIVEGRNKANPYRIGPTLQFTNGKLLVCGKEAAEIKTSQWYSVKGSLQLGPNAPKTFTLSLEECSNRIDSGKAIFQNRVFPFVHKEFDSLDWFGFISAASSITTVDMDDTFLIQKKND